MPSQHKLDPFCSVFSPCTTLIPIFGLWVALNQLISSSTGFLHSAHDTYFGFQLLTGIYLSIGRCICRSRSRFYRLSLRHTQDPCSISRLWEGLQRCSHRSSASQCALPRIVPRRLECGFLDNSSLYVSALIDERLTRNITADYLST